MRAIISASKAVAAKLTPRGGVEVNDLSYMKVNLNPMYPQHRLSVSNAHHDSPQPFSCLPEIPLPHFEDDFRYWPTFRNTFLALVDGRQSIAY